MAGLSRDLIDAVCEEAGVDCAHVVAPPGACWNSETNNGIGMVNLLFKCVPIVCFEDYPKNMCRADLSLPDNLRSHDSQSLSGHARYIPDPCIALFQ